MKSLEKNKTLEQVIAGIDELLAAASPSSSRSQVREVLAESAIPHRFVLTSIGSLRMALPIDGLVEVGSLPTITLLPNLPDWILGIVNVRSEIISVIDLADFLDIPATGTPSADQLVIIRHREMRTGIQIERIFGTVSRSRDEQNIPLPPEIKKENREFFSPGGFLVDDQEYFILDVQQFLTSSRFLNFNQTR